MSKKLQLWTRGPDGELQVNVVTAWSTVAFSNGAAGGLRLEYARDGAAEAVVADQFRLTARQARELSRGLALLAGQLEGQALAARTARSSEPA